MKFAQYRNNIKQTYASTNFFAAGTTLSSEALRFSVPPGGIAPFPETGGTPQMPSGSVIGSNLNTDTVDIYEFMLLLIHNKNLYLST